MPATPASMGANHSADLVTAYEGETAAAHYFTTLADFHDGTARATLQAFAAVEQVTSRALESLVEAEGLHVADRAALRQRGVARAEAERDRSWDDLLAGMCRDYPDWVPAFERVLAIAPPEHRAVAQLLVEHEIALVDTVVRLRAGADEPLAPVERFLQRER